MHIIVENAAYSLPEEKVHIIMSNQWHNELLPRKMKVYFLTKNE
jgi:hypothetical protein